MVAGIGAKLAKLLLWVFTFSLWLAGLGLVIVGSIVVADQSKYTDIFGSNNIKVLAGTTLGLGCYAFLVGFAGCRGTCKEGTGWLKLYWVLTLIIILAELTVGILALVYDDELLQGITDNLQTSIQVDYGIAEATTLAVDSLQEETKCCGSVNYTDWTTAAGFTEEDKAVPASCCKANTPPSCNAGSKGSPDNLNQIYTAGCAEASAQAVQDNYLLIGVICMCLIVFEILTMVFTCCVIDAIEKGELGEMA